MPKTTRGPKKPTIAELIFNSVNRQHVTINPTAIGISFRTQEGEEFKIFMPPEIGETVIQLLRQGMDAIYESRTARGEAINLPMPAKSFQVGSVQLAPSVDGQNVMMLLRSPEQHEIAVTLGMEDVRRIHRLTLDVLEAEPGDGKPKPTH